MKYLVPKFDLIPGVDLDALERLGNDPVMIFFSEERQFATYLTLPTDGLPRWEISYPISRVEVLARARGLESLLRSKLATDAALRELAEAYKASQGDAILAARAAARLDEHEAEEASTEAAAQDFRQLEAVRQSVRAAGERVAATEQALLAYWKPRMGDGDARH